MKRIKINYYNLSLYFMLKTIVNCGSKATPKTRPQYLQFDRYFVSV